MPRSFAAKPKGLNSWQPKASCHEDRNSCWTDGLSIEKLRSRKRKPITTQAETFMTYGDKRVSAVYVCISSDDHIFAVPVFLEWGCEEEHGAWMAVMWTDIWDLRINYIQRKIALIPTYQNRGINTKFSLAYLLVQMNTHVGTFLCFNAAKPVADPWYLQQTGKKLVKVRWNVSPLWLAGLTFYIGFAEVWVQLLCFVSVRRDLTTGHLCFLLWRWLLLEDLIIQSSSPIRYR